MQVNLHSTQGNQFTNYSDNSVTVNNQVFTTNIIISQNQIKETQIKNVAELSLENLLSIIQDSSIDIIIFGTGKSIQMPSIEILQYLQKKHIGFEVMPIAALCRTFNYLMGEGRNVLGIILF